MYTCTHTPAPRRRLHARAAPTTACMHMYTSAPQRTRTAPRPPPALRWIKRARFARCAPGSSQPAGRVRPLLERLGAPAAFLMAKQACRLRLPPPTLAPSTMLWVSFLICHGLWFGPRLSSWRHAPLSVNPFKNLLALFAVGRRRSRAHPSGVWADPATMHHRCQSMQACFQLV